jgi:hypothetical protein
MITSLKPARPQEVLKGGRRARVVVMVEDVCRVSVFDQDRAPLTIAAGATQRLVNRLG